MIHNIPLAKMKWFLLKGGLIVSRLADLSLLTVERVIVHQIPYRRKNEETEPVLSEVESTLNSRLRRFFREKIIENASCAFRVGFCDNNDSPVPYIISVHLENVDCDLVRNSRSLAWHLYDCQQGVNPEGLLIVVDCRVGEIPVLVIMKLEREEGAQIDQDMLNGRRTFNITHIDNLILTKKTRIFKVALFAPSENGETIEGLVCDKQRATASSKAVADFFLGRFLGCCLAEEPMVLTKRFFETVEHFVKDSITDPIIKERILTHMVSELTNERQVFNPQVFIRDYIPMEYRDVLDHELRGQGLMVEIEKDISLINDKLRKLIYEFNSGIKVVVPYEARNNVAHMDRLDDGKVEFRITDHLKRIEPR